MPNAAKICATWASSFAVPTRIAPWRSAVTRPMLPSRSAVSGWAARWSAFTSVETSTSVV